MTTIDKKKLIAALNKRIQLQFNQLQEDARGLTESLESEGKSTAGDKHNTARAMIHLEQEKLGVQIGQLQQKMNALKLIEAVAPQEKIGFGNLVITSNGLFLLGLSLGKIPFGDYAVFCLSLESPIGRQLHCKRVGDSLLFMKEELEIIAIK
jgi:transcription elongation GreA/GreB family factor